MSFLVVIFLSLNGTTSLSAELFYQPVSLIFVDMLWTSLWALHPIWTYVLIFVNPSLDCGYTSFVSTNKLFLFVLRTQLWAVYYLYVKCFWISFGSFYTKKVNRFLIWNSSYHYAMLKSWCRTCKFIYCNWEERMQILSSSLFLQLCSCYQTRTKWSSASYQLHLMLANDYLSYLAHA